MRIAQVSDIHIRNLKFHQDYRRVFADFHRRLEELHVDLVAITGDTAHAKTNISPEYVGLTSEFLTETVRRAPVIITLGNHDLNLMNPDRQDAITPIVEALANERIVLLKGSGPFEPYFPGFNNHEQTSKFCFWNFGIADVEHWPRPLYPEDQINIGLFHGSIRNCLTDSLFRMTHTEYDTDIFEGLDFVMMGDIHKRQAFNDGRAWYAGSMIQQNFGEDPEKGFLLWDIGSRDQWDVRFVELKGSRHFYTIKLPDDLQIPEMAVEPDSRIRVSPPRQLTLVEQRTVEKLIRKRYGPHDVITLGVQNVGQMFASGSAGTRIENLRDLSVQEGLLRQYLDGRKVSSAVMDRVLDLNRKYHRTVEQADEMARGISWRILRMGWNNLYNYGEGNVIDFSQIRGLTGIFAPNAAGKSGMVDVITVGMFDANTKEVSKNVHLINDNKDQATIILELLANRERFTITRDIERIKVGMRKGQEREWGKTTLDFVRHDEHGAEEKLVQENRPDTERQIRQRFGTFDDFMLTALFAQWDPMDLIMCKETDRKRILFRFLDLDIFEEKAALAKEDAREWLDRLVELEEGNYEEAAKNLRSQIAMTDSEIEDDGEFIADQVARGQWVQAEIERLIEEKESVPQIGWDLVREQSDLVYAERRIEEYKEEIRKLEYAGEDLTCAPGPLEHALGLMAEEVFDEGAHEDAAKELEDLQESIASLEHEVEVEETRAAGLERQKRILGNVPCGDQFPGCQFLVDAFRAKGSLEGVRRQIEEWNQELEIDRSRERSLQKVKDRYDLYLKWKEETDYYRQAKSVAKLKTEALLSKIEIEEAKAIKAREHIAAIERAAADVLRNETLDQRIGVARLNKGIIEDALAQRRAILAEHHEELGSNQGILKRIEESLDTLHEVQTMCSAFEHFTGAMGKDGIALQVLTQKLPVINEEINKILGSSCEFGAFIEYDPEDQSIRLYLQYGQYKSRVLELGSGAEKFLASVAIRAALLSISNLPRSNMFIIDEGFGKLDPEKLESIQRMFDYLRSVFDHVIVISHTDVMKDMVDNIIDITADDEGYAHVEIGG